MSRRQEILDAAIEVLAAAGSRGLTHRAVDRAARLPGGSTSNLFRTREALVGAIVGELVTRDKEHLGRLEALVGPGFDVGTFLAEYVVQTVTERRAETLARYAILVDPDARALSDGRTRVIEHLHLRARAAGIDAAPGAITVALAFVDGIMADAVIFDADIDVGAVADTINWILRAR